MQDTFYLKDVKSKLPDEKVVKEVTKAHEGGVDGSKGWQYKWDAEDAKKVLLRTHTTSLSIRKLMELGKTGKDIGSHKFFALGKCLKRTKSS